MKDKVFVIVGGLGLLGRAIVKDLLKKKYQIFIADIQDIIPKDFVDQIEI